MLELEPSMAPPPRHASLAVLGFGKRAWILSRIAPLTCRANCSVGKANVTKTRPQPSRGGVHETCQSYQARNLFDDFKCDAKGVCLNCNHKRSVGCYAMGAPFGQNHFSRVYPKEYGRINSTDTDANARQMVAEIGVRGPIACAVCVTAAFEAYAGGIFEDTTNCTTLDHSISIAGYGHDEASGRDYWIGRNSWGTYWGEKVRRYIDAWRLCARHTAGWP